MLLAEGNMMVMFYMQQLLRFEMVMVCRSEGNWGEYGLSKAAVNCYTIELGKRFDPAQDLYVRPDLKMLLNEKMFRFPKITSTSCSPGFIETDLTRGFATRSGKTPQEMGMLTVEMVSMNFMNGIFT